MRRQPDPPPDWVIVQRLVADHPIGNRPPTRTEAVHAIRELIRRGQHYQHVIHAVGLNGGTARAVVNEARQIPRTDRTAA